MLPRCVYCILLLWLAALLQCVAGGIVGIDPKVKFCTRVIDNFNFGLVEKEEFDETTGRSLGVFISKADANVDPNVEIEWARYKQCVTYLTNDAWTRTEYLNYAAQGDVADAAIPPYRPKHLVLGVQYPVVLTPGKPNFSRFHLIPAYDFVVGSFVKHSGTYDPNEERILRTLVFEGDCAVEIGSNIGAYTVVLADQVGKSGLVYAFEPFRKVFQIMNANLALQGYGNVITKQLGISNKQQFISVQAPDLNNFTNLGAARVFYQQKEEVARVPFDGFEEIEVETLDGVRINCGKTSGSAEKKVDFIKIDAEGMEIEVVEGGLGLINAHQPVIYAESQPYFQAGDDKFFKKMHGYGYLCSPVPELRMHEIVLCIPMSRYEELKQRLPLLQR